MKLLAIEINDDPIQQLSNVNRIIDWYKTDDVKQSLVNLQNYLKSAYGYYDNPKLHQVERLSYGINYALNNIVESLESYINYTYSMSKTIRNRYESNYKTIQRQISDFNQRVANVCNIDLQEVFELAFKAPDHLWYVDNVYYDYQLNGTDAKVTSYYIASLESYHQIISIINSINWHKHEPITDQPWSHLHKERYPELYL
jgi:hypothetical protein